MRARIASEIRRPDSGTMADHITNAINTAITSLQKMRLYFTESRSLTFSTVANQEFYTSADNANIGLIEKIDFAQIYISDQPYNLCGIAMDAAERLSMNGTYTGQPYNYCFVNGSFRLLPIPTTVYTVRIGGVAKVAAPASDVETGNPWMTDAADAVRCLAKYELFEHVLYDIDKAGRLNPEAEGSPTARAIKDLRNLTNAITRQGSGGTFITPVAF